MLDAFKQLLSGVRTHTFTDPPIAAQIQVEERTRCFGLLGGGDEVVRRSSLRRRPLAELTGVG